ncbi:hypothetical protein BCR33DRAFT_806568 [Rhizoclosmatium globosum]|uniref:Uncharacterized protein n=1 Tax=Rhizoclosmatium globosum TaxID=329046 RepID=A0A1Y2CLB0_9FUNG|nr:hypothetical protein BCR33DRAFT_806568 [Rhizoclosmatium globosum]|eukprot:ORY47808.1 hypothetical protein BCR33DRAFT_806568 [Rhizoclosmatium globosum]
MVVLLTLLAVSSGATASLLNTDGIKEPGARISEAPKVPAPIQARVERQLVLWVQAQTHLWYQAERRSDSKHVIVEAAVLPPTGAGCYPLFNNQYTYIETHAQVYQSQCKHLFVCVGSLESILSCDSSLTPACYDDAFDGKATLWKVSIDYQVGVAPDYTIWKRVFGFIRQWQSVSGSVRALDMVQLPDFHLLYRYGLSTICMSRTFNVVSMYACAKLWLVKSIDASPDGTNFIGVGMDNLVYLRSGLHGSWNRIQTAGEVVDVTILLDESILGTAPDGTLWTLNSPSAPWVKVPNGCCVIRTSLTRTGIIIGVGPDNKLYQKVNLQAPWVLVPGSGSVISVSYYKSLPQVNILLGMLLIILLGQAAEFWLGHGSRYLPT